MGAQPLYLSASFILEEGFALADLKRIVESMARAAREAGVSIVTGDTKVVERGKGDGVFITTTGVGVVREGITLSGDRAQPGDKILLSGTLGDHGMAILSQREGLSFDAPIVSDTAALARIGRGHAGQRRRPARAARPDARRTGDHAQRDRPAIATWAWRCRKRRSRCIPPWPQRANSWASIRCMSPTKASWWRSAQPQDAARLLEVMRAHPLARDAAIIGEVVEDSHGFVQMTTRLGGRRIVDWLTGEQLPRIC